MEKEKYGQFFISLMKANIKKVLEKKQIHFKEEVFDWVIETILLRDKYEVDHSSDPYWDSSGEVLLTEKKYELSDYETLDDFFQEYNGSSSPSFQSGCGMYHDYYSENLDEWVMGFIDVIFTEAVTTMIREDNDFEKWTKELMDGSFESEAILVDSLKDYLYNSEFDDFLYLDVTSSILDSIYKTNIKKIFEERKDIVIAYFDEEKRDLLKRREEYEILLTKLNKKSGKKIISIAMELGRAQTFYVENDKITSHMRYASETYGRHFKTMVLEGLRIGAGITVRQITSLEIEIENEGEKRVVPISKISGIRLGDNTWKGVSKEEMEIAHCTNSKTGERLPKEVAVQYVSFSEHETKH